MPPRDTSEANKPNRPTAATQPDAASDQVESLPELVDRARSDYDCFALARFYPGSNRAMFVVEVGHGEPPQTFRKLLDTSGFELLDEQFTALDRWVALVEAPGELP